MNKDNYILFHSHKCLHSKELLQLLYKDPQLNQKVTKVNVDNQNIKLPAYVKSVPTLIITENQKPSLLVGSKIFEWYKNLHKKESQNNQIQDWDPSTMTGYSDGFSYLESDDVIKKNAFCAKCEDGTRAPFTHRKSNATEQIIIGESDYVALCRKCYLDITKEKNLNNLTK